MYQPVDKALGIEWWAKLSYLEGNTDRIQVITPIKHKLASVLRQWRREIRDHENTTTGFESRC